MCTSNEYTIESFKNIFLKKYKDQFGFILPDRPIIIDDIRIRALAKSAMNINRKIGIRSNDKPLKESKVNLFLFVFIFVNNFSRK
jgi:N-methylhydantoinase A/oxoprolinase/acetone carboxylase beta subunit